VNASKSRLRLDLRTRLLLSYLLVVGVGALVVVLTTGLVAPSFYDIHMAGMTGNVGIVGNGGSSGTGNGSGMMGQGGMMQGSDAALRGAYQESVLQSVLAGVAASIVIALVVSLFVSDRIAGPVKRLASAARRIASGHYAERVPAAGVASAVVSGTEIEQLSASFNDMASSLEATERRRIELLGDVAHELRTPINSLQGYLEGLLDGVMQPTPELWARMHSEAGRMQRLVNDLQDLSRAESRQLSLKVEPIDPVSIVNSAVGAVQAHYAEKGLELRTQLEPGLPHVLADRDRAVQVLTNLLNNALRYTLAPGVITLCMNIPPAGQERLSPSLGSTVNSARSGSGEVLFEVSDTGIGIAPDHLPHLFERFYRVDKSRSRAAGGSGIGLTIAQALVQVMGGLIWAESAGLGKGSTFSFTLPIAH
jgi:signal transduction histidine kinase